MKKIAFIIIQLVLFQAVLSQGLPTVKPELAGFSSGRLDRIKPVMQRYVDENKLPGLITMVARQGKIVHFEKYGMMDQDKPMQMNTIFRIASMSKPVTSVAVMILYEKGYFQLDDPVAKYIPEFKNLKVFSSKDKDGLHLEDLKRPMTIRDLLTHTSGLTYGFFGNTVVDTMYRKANLWGGTLKDMIQKLSEIPLLYQPGTKWNYSFSTDVLGYLVEVVSGKSFDVFLKENIFSPLKMTDTGFNVPKEKINRCSAIYGISDNKGIKVISKPDTSQISRPAKLFSGGGGLFSTAGDYLIFAQMLLNKGEVNGVRLLGTKTVDFMTENHLDEGLVHFESNHPGLGFGLGFSVVMDVPKTQTLGSAGAYGWSGIYNTYFSIDPKEKLICILMTQFSPFAYYPVNREFNVLVYQAIVD
jgi:CubicO group peptidase (beta-lactamase class C family)